MQSEGTFSSATVRGYVYLAAGEGLDVPATLADAGIDGPSFEDPDGHLSRAQVENLARAIMSRMDRRFLVRALEKLGPGDFGVQEYALRLSPTLGDAYSRVIRYHRLTNQLMDAALRSEGDDVALSLTCPPLLDETLLGLSVETWTVALVVQGRQITKVDWVPRRVDFECKRPPHADEYDRFFRCPIRFEQAETSIVMPRELLALPVIGADRSLDGLVIAHLEAQLKKLPPVGAVSARLRTVVIEALGDGVPAMEECARQLGMSRRTLQRRLEGEQTTFQNVVDGARRELAESYLGKPLTSLQEIAFLLGFSTQEAFHRAFKRWTGVTPGEFRKRLAEAS
jgi:AraC-like DNA-binding protein